MMIEAPNPICSVGGDGTTTVAVAVPPAPGLEGVDVAGRVGRHQDPLAATSTVRLHEVPGASVAASQREIGRTGVGDDRSAGAAGDVGRRRDGQAGGQEIGEADPGQGAGVGSQVGDREAEGRRAAPGHGGAAERHLDRRLGVAGDLSAGAGGRGPLCVEVTAPVVLVLGPGVLPTTLTETVHEAPAAAISHR